MDTAAKRASAVNVGSPWRGILPFPDGVIDQGDRQTVAFMYSGILAGVQAVVGGRYQDPGIWPPQSEFERQWRQKRKEEIAAVEAEVIEAKAAIIDTDAEDLADLLEFLPFYDNIRDT